MKIKKGDKFKCIKDYVMHSTEIAFKKGVLYHSLNKGSLKSELHDKHVMDEEQEFNLYFTKDKIKKDSIVESVRKQLLDRSNVGIKKYGVTLDRNDLSLLDWLEHAKQEQMDSVLYLERIIQEIKKETLEFPHRQS